MALGSLFVALRSRIPLEAWDVSLFRSGWREPLVRVWLEKSFKKLWETEFYYAQVADILLTLRFLVVLYKGFGKPFVSCGNFQRVLQECSRVEL